MLIGFRRWLPDWTKLHGIFEASPMYSGQFPIVLTELGDPVL